MNPTGGGADDVAPPVAAAPWPLAAGGVDDVALGPVDGETAAQPITMQDHNGSRRRITAGV